MTSKEMTSHIRNRITVAGVKGARVRMAPSTRNVIQVFPKGGVDAEFTADEQIIVATIAEVNGLTLTRGLPIVVGQGTHGHGFTFEMPRR
jgi:hypothetical protein